MDCVHDVFFLLVMKQQSYTVHFAQRCRKLGTFVKEYILTILLPLSQHINCHFYRHNHRLVIQQRLILMTNKINHTKVNTIYNLMQMPNVPPDHDNFDSHINLSQKCPFQIFINCIKETETLANRIV